MIFPVFLCIHVLTTLHLYLKTLVHLWIHHGRNSINICYILIDYMVSFYEISELGIFHVFQVKRIYVYRIGSCLSFVFVILSTKSSGIFLQRRKEMNAHFLCHLVATPHSSEAPNRTFALAVPFDWKACLSPLSCWLSLLSHVRTEPYFIGKVILTIQLTVVLCPCTWHFFFVIFSLSPLAFS